MARRRRNSSEVPISGVHYVVGIGDAPAEPPLSDEVAAKMSSMREKFIQKWSEQSMSSRYKITDEEIEESGGLLWPVSEEGSK